MAFDPDEKEFLGLLIDPIRTDVAEIRDHIDLSLIHI